MSASPSSGAVCSEGSDDPSLSCNGAASAGKNPAERLKLQSVAPNFIPDRLDLVSVPA
jgi:hypothetical protein